MQYLSNKDEFTIVSKDKLIIFIFDLFILLFSIGFDSKRTASILVAFSFIFGLYFCRRNIDAHIVFRSSLLIYFLIGGINFGGVFIDIDSNNEKYALLFILGYDLFQLKPTGLYGDKKKYNNVRSLTYSIFCCLTIGAILLSWLEIKGIPLLMGEDARRGGSALLKIFGQLGFFICLAFFLNDINNKKFGFLLVIVAAFILFSGYRTPLIQGVGISVFYIFLKKREEVNLKKAGVIIVTIFILINIISSVRATKEYDFYKVVSSVENLGFDYNPILIPLTTILYNIKESPINFQIIRDDLSSTKKIGMGSYFVSNFLTFLPGFSDGYGVIYSRLVNSVSGRTKTASIIAPFYIDLGGAGVFVGGAVLSALTNLILMLAKKNFWCEIFLFYWFSNLFIWIHNGMIFQPSMLIISFGILIMHVFSPLHEKILNNESNITYRAVRKH